MPVRARVRARVAASLIVVALAPCSALAVTPASGSPDAPLAPVHLSRVRSDVTGGFQVSPPRLTDSISPGAHRDYVVTVLNQTGQRRTFTLDVFDLAPGSGATYADLVDSGTAERGAGSWLTLAKPSVVLDNLQQAEVPFRVRVPDHADAGGHYGAIRVSSRAPAENEGVQIESAIVEHVIVIVPGKVRYQLDASDVRVDRVASGSTTVRFTVRNRGNIHSSPSARVTLRGTLVDAEATADVPELLPGGRRRMKLVLRDLPRLGVARASVAIAGEDGREWRRGLGRVYIWSRAAAIGSGIVIIALVGAFVAWRRARSWRRYLDVDDDVEPDEANDADAP